MQCQSPLIQFMKERIDIQVAMLLKRTALILAKVFVIFKQLNKTHTVTDVDPLRYLMKRRVTKAFESNSLRVLNLHSKKKNSLIDFIASLPEMTTKAATRGNILHVFYESGLIDWTKSRYPVLLKILGTCRSTPPKELYQEVFDSFIFTLL